jgi:hypothetical protein
MLSGQGARATQTKDQTMTNAEKTALATNYVADFRSSSKALKTALIEHAGASMLVSHSWLVIMNDAAMIYDLTPFKDEQGRTRYNVANPRNGGPIETVARYTKADAEQLASLTTDGNGDNAIAMHWTDAAEAEIARLDHTIGIFAKFAA